MVSMVSERSVFIVMSPEGMHSPAFQFKGLDDFIKGMRKRLRTEEDNQLSE